MFQYWADIKYKARKKSAAGGALGDLSSAEERLRNILNNGSRDCEIHQYYIEIVNSQRVQYLLQR